MPSVVLSGHIDHPRRKGNRFAVTFLLQHKHISFVLVVDVGGGEDESCQNLKQTPF